MDRVHVHPGEACPMLHSLAVVPQHGSKRRAKLEHILIAGAEIDQKSHTALSSSRHCRVQPNTQCAPIFEHRRGHDFGTGIVRSQALRFWAKSLLWSAERRSSVLGRFSTYLEAV